MSINSERAMLDSRAMSFGLADACFPKRIGFQDIDMTAAWVPLHPPMALEWGHRFFYGELKGRRATLKRGQAIYWHRRLSRDGPASVLFVFYSDSKKELVSLEDVKEFQVVFAAEVDGEVRITSPSQVGAELEFWLVAWRNSAEQDNEAFASLFKLHPSREFDEGVK